MEGLKEKVVSFEIWAISNFWRTVAVSFGIGVVVGLVS